jgi:hypothetical protein
MTNVTTVSDKNTNQKLQSVTTGTIPWFSASVKLVMNCRGIRNRRERIEYRNFSKNGGKQQ